MEGGGQERGQERGQVMNEVETVHVYSVIVKSTS